MLDKNIFKSLEMLKRGVKLYKTMAHSPNTVEFFGWGNFDDTKLFLVMEYTDGQSLQALMTRNISIKSSMKIVFALIYALEYMHGHKILHLSLQPSKILIDKQSRKVQLLGFSSRKYTTNFASLIHNYMAPELIQNSEKISAQADIYSLGAILYHLLSGQTPYGEITRTSKMLDAKLKQDPLTLNNKANIFTEIVKKAMAPEPQKRYKNVSCMAHALQKAINTYIKITNINIDFNKFVYKAEIIPNKVHLAQHLDYNVQAVFKTLPKGYYKEVVRGSRARARDNFNSFKTNIESIRTTLVHPNIIHIFGWHTSEQKGWPTSEQKVYLVMEYFNAWSLEQLMAKLRVIPLKYSIQIAVCIASALSCMHRHKIHSAHLAPSNIFIEKQTGIVKVKVRMEQESFCRYAISMDEIRSTRDYKVMLYKAPECITGQNKKSKQADIYSLGAILYHTVANKAPYDEPCKHKYIEDIDVVIKNKVMSQDPIPIQQLRKNIPDALAKTIHKALSRDPAKRHQSSDEFAKELQKVLDVIT
ncbi:serine/threonine protein kinase [Candidatus Uabimicrobium amorphum]|uniref:Serine/threonine protein kinase n=1 Tax=Uabimicrobium amorphum TaxID=2596890 RepID=A0A5S9F501_UABAM|nr:serine/threonine protein kinase [Candidatus Uabimicrobium amorphum]